MTTRWRETEQQGLQKKLLPVTKTYTVSETKNQKTMTVLKCCIALMVPNFLKHAFTKEVHHGQHLQVFFSCK